jgi:hypothetical protein
LVGSCFGIVFGAFHHRCSQIFGHVQWGCY